RRGARRPRRLPGERRSPRRRPGGAAVRVLPPRRTPLTNGRLAHHGLASPARLLGLLLKRIMPRVNMLVKHEPGGAELPARAGPAPAGPARGPRLDAGRAGGQV